MRAKGASCSTNCRPTPTSPASRPPTRNTPHRSRRVRSTSRSTAWPRPKDFPTTGCCRNGPSYAARPRATASSRTAATPTKSPRCATCRPYRCGRRRDWADSTPATTRAIWTTWASPAPRSTSVRCNSCTCRPQRPAWSNTPTAAKPTISTPKSSMRSTPRSAKPPHATLPSRRSCWSIPPQRRATPNSAPCCNTPTTRGEPTPCPT